MTRESQLKAARKYYHANKERIAETRSIWDQNNKEQQNDYHRDYFHGDPQRRISHSHRNCVRKIILNHRSGKKYCPNKLGIKDREALLDHLGRDKIDNYGKAKEQYCIDHIIPLSNFDLTKETECLKAFNYKNLQLITNAENQSKGHSQYHEEK